MDDAALVAGIQEYLTLSGQDQLTNGKAKLLEKAMFCLKDRAKTFPEIIEKAAFVLNTRPIFPDEKSAGALDPVSRGILAELTPHLQNASWNRDTLEGIVKSLAEAHGMGLGKLAGPLRAALAGRSVSPSVFDMMLVLGREETILRLTDCAA
jgi:glutamyl-tRNA synthetase